MLADQVSSRARVNRKEAHAAASGHCQQVRCHCQSKTKKFTWLWDMASQVEEKIQIQWVDKPPRPPVVL